MVIEVQSIQPAEAIPWLKHKHYARRVCPISYAFGAYRGPELVGICTFGVSSSSTMRRGVCGDEWESHVLELNRLCCENTKNMASLLVGRALQLLPKPSIVVSYADTGQGHIGFVYQATNFLYTGLSTRFKDPKVVGLEHQHHSTYAHGRNMEELRQEYGDKLYYVDRSRKHRYVFFCGDKRQVRMMRQSLRYPVHPYPKGASQRYDASTAILTQQRLF